jgi:hypothetical protein
MARAKDQMNGRLEEELAKLARSQDILERSRDTLEQSVALLNQTQAIFVQNEAKSPAQKAETDKRIAVYEQEELEWRRRFDERFARIEAALAELILLHLRNRLDDLAHLRHGADADVAAS